MKKKLGKKPAGNVQTVEAYMCGESCNCSSMQLKDDVSAPPTLQCSGTASKK